jgi:D-glycero-alpha-D-manno-heptose-7-phosphate kinase
LHRAFTPEIIIKYSRHERVASIDEIEHPIIREALKYLKYPNEGIELTSLADIPSGTGLGSSGSFTTALLAALHTNRRNVLQKQQLAQEACHIEIDLLGEPIGKQDQYIAAFGGLTCFDFAKDGTVTATPLNVSQETFYNLEDNLLLFFTGYSRSASSILKEQDDQSRDNNQSMIDNLHFVKELGLKSKAALEAGDLHEFANLMNVHWQHKKKRSSKMSNPKIDEWYELALKNGALGGKMIGAGGGGFLMFYTEDKMRLRHAMMQAGMREVRFAFDLLGTRVERNH